MKPVKDLTPEELEAEISYLESLKDSVTSTAQAAADSFDKGITHVKLAPEYAKKAVLEGVKTVIENPGQVARLAAQGATFGLSDNLEARARAPFQIGTYEEILEGLNKDTAEFVAKHPLVSTLAYLASPMGVVAGGAKNVPIIGKSAVSGMKALPKATQTGLKTGAKAVTGARLAELHLVGSSPSEPPSQPAPPSSADIAGPPRPPIQPTASSYAPTYKPTSFYTTPSSPPITTGQFLRQLLQGASFGWADEGEAFLRALFSGRPYSEHQKEISDQNKAYEKENPWTSTAIQAGAGFAVPGGLIGKAAVKAGQALPTSPLLKALGAGVGTGTAAGAGYADPGEKVSGAKVGATTGGFLGAGTHVVATSARKLFGEYVTAFLNKANITSDEKTAVKDISKNLRDGNISPEQARLDLQKIAVEQNSRLIDLNDDLRGTLSTSAKSLDPEGTSKLIETEISRVAEAPLRADKTIRNIMVKSGAAEDTLLTKHNGVNKLADNLYASTDDLSPETLAIIKKIENNKPLTEKDRMYIAQNLDESLLADSFDYPNPRLATHDDIMDNALQSEDPLGEDIIKDILEDPDQPRRPILWDTISPYIDSYNDKVLGSTILKTGQVPKIKNRWNQAQNASTKEEVNDIRADILAGIAERLTKVITDSSNSANSLKVILAAKDNLDQVLGPKLSREIIDYLLKEMQNLDVSRLAVPSPSRKVSKNLGDEGVVGPVYFAEQIGPGATFGAMSGKRFLDSLLTPTPRLAKVKVDALTDPKKSRTFLDEIDRLDAKKRPERLARTANQQLQRLIQH